MSYRKVNLGEVLEQFGKAAADGMKEALARGADAIAADAKGRVPAKTGRLRDSIHTVPNRDGTRIKITADAKNPEDGVPYGRLLEFSPKLNRPFLYPAYDAHRDATKQAIIGAIRKAVSKR